MRENKFKNEGAMPKNWKNDIMGISRGCGDHSCVTATNKSGQMTNGGCRCSPIALKKHIWTIENENRLLKAEIEGLKQSLQLPTKDGQ